MHIRDEIARAEREEKELEQQIMKEKAKLDKVNLIFSFNFSFIPLFFSLVTHTTRR